jgi:hypothetical protein
MSPESLALGSIPGIIHRAPSETVEMNKYHFLLVLMSMRDQETRFRPRGEWCLIPLGIFLTSLQSLVTTTFRDFLISSAGWEAFTAQLAWVSAVATIGLFCWWVFDKYTRQIKTPEQILNEITDQMETGNRGEPSRDRTEDPLIKSQVLYQLS